MTEEHGISFGGDPGMIDTGRGMRARDPWEMEPRPFKRRSRAFIIPHGNKPLNIQIEFRLFQAAMWRTYAQKIAAGDAYIVNTIARGIGYEGCKRLARLNLRLARRLRRRAK